MKLFIFETYIFQLLFQYPDFFFHLVNDCTFVNHKAKVKGKATDENHKQTPKFAIVY